MVKLDQQARPDALAGFGEYGTYVPRIFLLDSTGSLLPDITSGHARYPYFYSAQQLGSLKAAMRKALKS